jgi:hypothetical protein
MRGDDGYFFSYKTGAHDGHASKPCVILDMMILCYYYEGEIESTEQANNQWGLLLSLVLVLLLATMGIWPFFSWSPPQENASDRAGGTRASRRRKRDWPCRLTNKYIQP